MMRLIILRPRRKIARRVAKVAGCRRAAAKRAGGDMIYIISLSLSLYIYIYIYIYVTCVYNKKHINNDNNINVDLPTYLLHPLPHACSNIQKAPLRYLLLYAIAQWVPYNTMHADMRACLHAIMEIMFRMTGRMMIIARIVDAIWALQVWFSSTITMIWLNCLHYIRYVHYGIYGIYGIKVHAHRARDWELLRGERSLTTVLLRAIIWHDVILYNAIWNYISISTMAIPYD